MTTMEAPDMAKRKAESKVQFPKRFPLNLTAEQFAALERIQAETGAPIAAIIRRAIDRELEARGITPATKGGRHGK